jgi:hypothetical protein
MSVLFTRDEFALLFLTGSGYINFSLISTNRDSEYRSPETGFPAWPRRMNDAQTNHGKPHGFVVNNVMPLRCQKTYYWTNRDDRRRRDRACFQSAD